MRRVSLFGVVVALGTTLAMAPALADEAPVVDQNAASIFVTLPADVIDPEGITSNPANGDIYVGNFAPGGLNTLLLGQNYHLLHHLYPRMPFYRYAACFRAVRPVLEAERARIEGA